MLIFFLSCAGERCAIDHPAHVPVLQKDDGIFLPRQKRGGGGGHWWRGQVQTGDHRWDCSTQQSMLTNCHFTLLSVCLDQCSLYSLWCSPQPCSKNKQRFQELTYNKNTQQPCISQGMWQRTTNANNNLVKSKFFLAVVNHNKPQYLLPILCFRNPRQNSTVGGHHWGHGPKQGRGPGTEPHSWSQAILQETSRGACQTHMDQHGTILYERVKNNGCLLCCFKSLHLPSTSILWTTLTRWRREQLWTTPSSTSRFLRFLCASATKWVPVCHCCHLCSVARSDNVIIFLRERRAAWTGKTWTWFCPVWSITTIPGPG